MSGAKRAKHIYFDIEYWRELEKTFADSAAKFASDDNTRRAIIARCNIGLMRFLEQDAEFGTAKKLPLARKAGAPKRDPADRLHVWLAVELQKALSTSNRRSLERVLSPLFRKGHWRVLTNYVDGKHLVEVECFDKAEGLHREGKKMLESNPTL